MKTVLIPLARTFPKWDTSSELGPMISPSTCFCIRTSKYRSSRCAFQLVLHRKMVYPASTAASSIPGHLRKEWVCDVGNDEAYGFVSFLTKPWAIALGWYPISKAIFMIRFWSRQRLPDGHLALWKPSHMRLRLPCHILNRGNDAHPPTPSFAVNVYEFIIPSSLLEINSKWERSLVSFTP